MSDLSERVAAVVRASYPAAHAGLIGGATFDTVGLDSLHVVGLLVTLQQQFDVTMSGDDVDLDATLEDVVELLRAKGAAVEQRS